MNLNEARKKILTEIKDLYKNREAENIAQLVLEKINNRANESRVFHDEIFLSPDKIEQLKKIITRLKLNEPVQYALEEAWFYGMKFKVNSNVLIPRPETEELVDWIIQEIKSQKLKAKSLLDIGTGSGCIPIAIKRNLPLIEVTAIEISNDAIKIAKQNAEDHAVAISFIQMDFLIEKNWEAVNKFDVIVSNPPYIRKREADLMHERVKEHEPHMALFVPDEDAMLFYRKLAAFAKDHLSENGSLFVEINEALALEVIDQFKRADMDHVEVKKDMQGKDRMVKATFTV